LDSFTNKPTEMANNKQQTAVEWLIEQLNSKYGGNDFLITHINEIEKAKEMDKEQKLNMFNCGRIYQVTGEGTFKQVYQEIYGGGNQ
jgi:disulfide oxidoreductase YuzD